MTSPIPIQMLLHDRQFVRCIFLQPNEEELLKEEAFRQSYRFIEVGLANIQAREDLMERIGTAFSFPSYFGANWDAFLDLLTDLSWNPAPGYVMLLKNADALLSLPSEDLATFIRLCSVAVERWQAEEDEDGKTIGRTPFYILLEGQAAFCRLVSDLLTSGEKI